MSDRSAEGPRPAAPGVANVLSIAGSDPSGGAGIQADLKTFGARGVYGMAVITALTVQNTTGVRAVHVPPPDFVAAEIDAIFEDIRVDAVKIGMLASGAVAAHVAARLAHHGARAIVLDPVLAASSGDSLGTGDLIAALRRHLFPLAALVTPNIPEAARLAGMPEHAGPRALGEALLAQGARAVLVKGGHLEGDTAEDMLVTAAGVRVYSAPRVATRNTHGTGCALSSAIAAGLARGDDLDAAIAGAKTWLTGALRGADQLSVGGGPGPLDHLWQVRATSSGAVDT